MFVSFLFVKKFVNYFKDSHHLPQTCVPAT